MHRVSTSRHLLALLAAGLFFTSCGGGSKGPIDGARAMAHVEKLVSFGPRPFGSDALGKAADYIEQELKSLGLSPKRHEVMHEKEKRLIRNLYVQIDGAGTGDDFKDKGPILIYGAHYDTKLTDGHSDAAHNFRFPGAIDGGGGPAVLLEMARELSSRPDKPKVNVWLYWIDAEESLDFQWNDQRALLGSKAFCKWLGDNGTLKRVKAFVLLDLIGSKNYKIDKDGNSHSQLQDIFAKAGDTIGTPERVYKFPTAEEHAYYKQRGIKWGTTDDHNTFSAYGVPSVLLIDFARRIPPHLQGLPEGQQPQVDPAYEQWWHTPDDDLAAMDPAALAFAGNLALAGLPDLEQFCLGKNRDKK